MMILRDADHMILGIPMLTCMAVGTASGFMQQVPNEGVKAVGWLGTHTAIILGIVCGVPLLVYSLAKVTFAKAFNTMTFDRFDSIRAFKEHAELQFTVSLVTVSAFPLIVMTLPHVVPHAYTAYQKYQEFQKAYDEFTQSDLYITLKKVYEQLYRLFSALSSGNLLENLEEIQDDQMEDQ